MYNRDELIEFATDNKILIHNAKTPKDANKIAIHLLNPTLADIADALDGAVRDNFKCIVCHTVLTWPSVK